MSKARIMIVEDEGIVALQMKESLESAGYFVPAIVSTGKDALVQIPEIEPDLILMDIHLKGEMDGVETAGEIRRAFDIPLIYLTAYSDDVTVERAKNTEPFGYILKPVSDKPLQLSIEMALRKAESEKSLKSSRELYSSILTGIGEGIIVSDLKGTIKFINTYAENTTEWKHDDAAGRKLGEVFSICDRSTNEPVTFALDDAILEGKVLRVEDQMLVSRKRKQMDVDYSIVPLRNKFENVIGIVFLFTAHGGQPPVEVTAAVSKDQAGVQGHILPEKGRAIGEYTCEWFYRKGTSSSRDLFNMFALGNDHIAFYIVDTAGHNYTNNIFLVNLQQFLSADIEKGGILVVKGKEGAEIVSPRDVVLELNRRFYFDLNNNPFFTLIYGVIHRPSGKTRVVRAGHPFPIYQDPTGKLTMIESEGYAIGMFPEIEVSEYEFAFERASRLYLYSDGLIDSTFADINQLSFSRLMEFLETRRSTPLLSLIALLEKEERKWHEKSIIPDDVIGFIIERR